MPCILPGTKVVTGEPGVTAGPGPGVTVTTSTGSPVDGVLNIVPGTDPVTVVRE